MRVLFVAALGAAVVFASPVYAASTGKFALFSEKRCFYYAEQLRFYDRQLAAREKEWSNSMSERDYESAKYFSKEKDMHLVELVKLATVYTAVCKP